jgi:predicted DCC family thiol-disulfide oxidoreductase YuxK
LLLRFPVLAQANFDSGMRFIALDGKVDVGADAVYQICRRLPSLRALAGLYPLPLINQASRLVYAVISANRKRLARNCDTTCAKD